MNKITIFIISAAFLFSSSLVYARSENASPRSLLVQSQNQNRGDNPEPSDEDQEISEESETDEATREGMPKQPAPRSEQALEKMSEVAKQVELLLTTRTTKGGIGEKVREIAREQRNAQSRIETELNKINGRGSILKALLGPDYKALKNMSEQIAQNQLRIQQLEELKTKLTFKSDITMVESVIQLLTEQNTLLENKIALEEKTSSLLGWLFKNFLK